MSKPATSKRESPLQKASTNIKGARGHSKRISLLLNTNEVLRGRYKISHIIGGGGFGQIFRAYDQMKKENVAVKIASKETDARRLKLEQMVLIMLRGKAHFPSLVACGNIRGSPYIIMQLVGRCLSELRRRESSRKLSAASVYRISIQSNCNTKVVTALRYLHEAGFLHRDIKPSNCCIGKGLSNRRKIYLLDFGMARIFLETDGTFRPARKHAGFRGTIRYVSLAVHARKDTGPCDDLIGWLYSIVELMDGELPWAKLCDHKGIENFKRKTTLKELCKTHPPTSLEYATYVTSLKRNDMPDYDKMIDMFKRATKDIAEETPFEWEKPGKKEKWRHNMQEVTAQSDEEITNMLEDNTKNQIPPRVTPGYHPASLEKTQST